MFGQGGEQKQNKQNGGDGQENNNHHDEKRRWFLVCEADYMAATNLNNTGEDHPQPINLMREEYPRDQYYLSCDDEDDDDRDYNSHSSNGNNNYSPFFNVNVYYNHTNDLFHLRRRQQSLRAGGSLAERIQSYKASDNNNNLLCWNNK
jgi:hypothetical protein